MKDDQDKLRRAYARLAGLKNNLPTGFYVSQDYVGEYHEALQHLEELELETSEFRVPQNQLKRRVVSSNYLTGEVDYADQPEVERTFLAAKIDSVLTYFDLITDTQSRKIGFRG